MRCACFSQRRHAGARSKGSVAVQVAGLTVAAEYNPHFQRLFTIFMSQLQGVLAPSVNIPIAYESGSTEEQAFIQNLALFFTAFFRVGRRSCLGYTAAVLAWETEAVMPWSAVLQLCHQHCNPD